MTELGKEGIAALEKAKNFGNRFFFEFFLEMFHDKLIEQFRTYLADYTPDNFRDMVLQKKYPYFEPAVFRSLHGYETYLGKIKTQRLFEALADARPDLAEVLWNLGDPNLPTEQKPGLLYVVGLRKHFMERVMGGGEGPEAVADLQEKPRKKMVTAKCENCGRSWPVPEEEFANITECPFCHAGADEPPEPMITPPPAETPPVEPPTDEPPVA